MKSKSHQIVFWYNSRTPKNYSWETPAFVINLFAFNSDLKERNHTAMDTAIGIFSNSAVKFCASPHDSWCKSDQRGCGASRRYHLCVSASEDWLSTTVTSNKMRQVWTGCASIWSMSSDFCQKSANCENHVCAGFMLRGFCCLLLLGKLLQLLLFNQCCSLFVLIQT